MIEDMKMRDVIALVDAVRGAAGPPTTPPCTPLLARHIGKTCVIRSHQSGVWLGVVAATDGRGVVLRAGARRAWSWSGAGSCSGLAVVGPSDGKITVPSSGDVTITEAAEVIDASPEAIVAWAAVPVWTGR